MTETDAKTKFVTHKGMHVHAVWIQTPECNDATRYKQCPELHCCAFKIWKIVIINCNCPYMVLVCMLLLLMIWILTIITVIITAYHNIS